MKQPILNIHDTVKLYTVDDAAITDPARYAARTLGNGTLLILDNQDSKDEGTPVRTDHYALIFCMKGTCRKIVDHHPFEVIPHSIHIVAPGQLSSYSHRSPDLTLKMIFFKRSFLDDLQVAAELTDQLLLVNPEHPPLFTTDPASMEAMLQLITGMQQEQETHAPFFLQIIRCQLLELLFRINRVCTHCLENTPKRSNRRFQVVHEYRKLVEKYFTVHNRVEEYAALLHITAKHLSDTVKQETGDTALTFIHQRILREAQFLLEYSALSIKEIAAYLNFDSSSHFSRFFRLKLGTSPIDYRQTRKIG
ncbi:AraC family transcriptional regulator [Chitinophaga nivalis]|uniref:Helix-turn-helix domain-containing protein n=1 Tax=Chitinophaga nivalis TaxID=2991709 RepID=A0ABT3IGP7_9BACT|nr:helix-turn-helix domain-containing protein [Chitinophaga nivalis]MCW3467165.1 helix-turn-helix domain-containing protein [Chitinophaga nivalis]MCW3483143.1 helix-turn-helix domain-containing protein [Chitinophaga nivalis]